MQFSVKLEGGKELSKALRGYDEKVRKGLQREVASTATRLHRFARKDAAVDTGLMRNRITFVVRDLAATVFSNARYSGDVEFGQKPGRWPNKQDIMMWVKRKLGVQRNKLKGVTFLVSRKIFEKGTDAQPFFEPAVKNAARYFYLRVKKRVLNTKL